MCTIATTPMLSAVKTTPMDALVAVGIGLAQLARRRCRAEWYTLKYKVKATNGVFGDPCGGTYKYLTVDYKCGKPGAVKKCGLLPFFDNGEFEADATGGYKYMAPKGIEMK